MKKFVFFVMIVVLATMLMGMAVTNQVCRTFTRTITGDSDSGIGGYWATDSYTSTYTVCTDGEGTSTVTRTDVGTFQTWGSTSPSGNDVVGAGVTGTINGTWTGIEVKGTINPAALSNLGSVDFGCDQNGVCSNYSSSLAQIFNPGYAATYPDTWSWDYQTCSGQKWNNSAEGNSGDIIGDPVSCGSKGSFGYMNFQNEICIFCARPDKSKFVSKEEQNPKAGEVTKKVGGQLQCGYSDESHNGLNDAGNWKVDENHNWANVWGDFALSQFNDWYALPESPFCGAWTDKNPITGKILSVDAEGKAVQIFHPAVLEKNGFIWLRGIPDDAIMLAGECVAGDVYHEKDLTSGKLTRVREKYTVKEYTSPNGRPYWNER